MRFVCLRRRFMITWIITSDCFYAHLCQHFCPDDEIRAFVRTALIAVPAAEAVSSRFAAAGTMIEALCSFQLDPGKARYSEVYMLGPASFGCALGRGP